MTAISGLGCLNPSPSSARAGSSLKTLEASLLGAEAWFSKQSVLTWRKKATKFGRSLFQLAPSARRIGATAFGSSPAPNASTRIQASEIREKAAGKFKRRGAVTRHSAQPGEATGLRLQPAFVEWTMGYPNGWTEISDSRLSEIRLCRRSPKRS